MDFREAVSTSYFLGRDGYRYWIGKVPSNFKTISDGNNWGERVPVRILGYHTEDTSILPDTDLPIAYVKKPTTVGAGNLQNSGIVGGEIVTGYFMDADEAQQPVIDGVLDRWNNDNQLTLTDLANGANPFLSSPLLESSSIPIWRIAGEGKNPDKNSLLQSQGKSASPKGDNAVNQISDATGGADFVPSIMHAYEMSKLMDEFNGPNNCGDDIVSRIRVEISKIVTILTGVKKYYNTYVLGAVNKVYDFVGQIQNVIQNIAAVMRTLVQRVRNYVLRELRRLLSEALEIVLGDVLKDIKDAVISEILDIIFCIFQTTIDELPGLIGDFIAALLGQLSASPLCAAEKFINALVNNILNSIQGVLDPIIADIEDLLNGVLDIGSAISSAIDQVLGLVGFLCLTKNCVEVTKFNSSPFGGPTKKQVDDYNSFLSQLTIPDIGSNAAAWLDNAGLTAEGQTSCDIANSPKCSPPIVSIFGGNPTAEALAAAVVSKKGSIIGVLLESRGLGYRYPPFVAFDDPCGYGSLAGGYAEIDDDGSLTGVIITNPGYGYIDDTDGSTNDNPNPDEREPIKPEPNPPIDDDEDPGSNTVDPGVGDNGGGGGGPIPDEDDPNPIVTVPVVGCLNGFKIVSMGYGYAEGDEIVTVPAKPGLILIPKYTDAGQLVEIEIKGETCGWTDLPDIQINSRTGAGAIIKPNLSFTKATDFTKEEQVRYKTSTLSVVQCIRS